jgi:hypothetical protein
VKKRVTGSVLRFVAAETIRTHTEQPQRDAYLIEAADAGRAPVVEPQLAAVHESPLAGPLSELIRV